MFIYVLRSTLNVSRKFAWQISERFSSILFVKFIYLIYETWLSTVGWMSVQYLWHWPSTDPELVRFKVTDWLLNTPTSRTWSEGTWTGSDPVPHWKGDTSTSHHYSLVQRQAAITAYLSSKQLPLFAFARQIYRAGTSALAGCWWPRFSRGTVGPGTNTFSMETCVLSQTVEAPEVILTLSALSTTLVVSNLLY